jgi:thioester reductase-like protein
VTVIVPTLVPAADWYGRRDRLRDLLSIEPGPTTNVRAPPPRHQPWSRSSPQVRGALGDVASDGLGLDEEGLLVLAGCDVVVHRAATVAFDAPLHTAVE